MSVPPANLDTWDYVTMTLMVTLATIVGFYHVFKVKKSSTTEEFLVFGKDIGFIPVVLSTVATVISPTSMQGYPLEIYMTGIQFVFFFAAHCIVVGFFVVLYLPVYYNIGISSIFQYLELRFNRTVRMMASIINTIRMVFTSAVLIYAPALSLNQGTGLNLWGSVMSIGIVCIIYTALGGIKAVIWADSMQLVVILAALSVVVIKGSYDVGGFQTIWNRAMEGERLNIYVYQSEYSRDTIWTYLIGGTFLGLSALVSSQMYVQRILSNPSLVKAKWSILLSTIIYIGLIIFYAIIGLEIYAKFYDCDPKLNGTVASRDQLVSLFAVETLQFIKGFPGIFVAGVLCATLSTLSSTLNGLSTVTLIDYIKPFYPDMSDQASTKVSKILAVAYGVLCIAGVALIANMGGIVRAMFTVGGAMGGPLFTVFTLGVLVPWVNSTGAICGFIASIVFGGWAAIGAALHKRRPLHAPLSIAGCNATSLIIENVTYSAMSSLQITTTTTTILPEVWNATLGVDAQQALGIPPENTFFLYTISPLWYTAITAMAGMTIGILVSIMTGPQNPNDLDPRLISPPIVNLCRRLPKKYRVFLGYESDKKRARMELPGTVCEKESEEMLEAKVPLKLEVRDK